MGERSRWRPSAAVAVGGWCKRMGSDPSAASDRAVTPVVGTILLVAITVVLAGVLAGVVLAFEMPEEMSSDSLAYDTEMVLNGDGNSGKPFVKIVVTAGRAQFGDDVYVMDNHGNEIQWEDVWTGDPTVTAGEFVHLDGFGSDSALAAACKGVTYKIVRRGQSSSELIISVPIDRAAYGPATAHC